MLTTLVSCFLAMPLFFGLMMLIAVGCIGLVTYTAVSDSLESRKRSAVVARNARIALECDLAEIEACTVNLRCAR